MTSKAAPHSPTSISIPEFKKHQEDILPLTSKYIGKTNLDIGCGNGLTSVIHNQTLGVHPTLCDVVDLRKKLSKKFPFKKLLGVNLPFGNDSFESCYLQYVLHHIKSGDEVVALLKEGRRVASRIIIVDEIKGSKTNVQKALKFDEEVNQRISPGVKMPVFHYYSTDEVESLFNKLNIRMIFHGVVSRGSEDNGFLETHVFVGE